MAKSCHKSRVWRKLASLVLMATTLSSNTSRSHIGVVYAFSAPSQLRSQLAKSTLFGVNGESSGKAIIDLLIDENRHTLLRPPSDPSRPILVDAFAPWCGPCKLLDKVLKKAQPRYLGKVDFCRWNVNDKENTVEIKSHFIDAGYTLNKLPSLIIYRNGEPIAVRPGFANEFQLDDWLETSLPDVLERTFDENGLKIEPDMMKHSEVKMEVETNSEEIVDKSSGEAVNDFKVTRQGYSPMDFKSIFKTERLRIIRKTDVQTTNGVLESEEDGIDDGIVCNDEEKCFELLEETVGWENRTVTPAKFGLPKRIIA